MTQIVKDEALRLFCAVELTEEARAAAVAHLARLRAALAAPARVSWEREEKLHLTLKFFGDVESCKVAALDAALARAANGGRPLALKLQVAGVFPSIARPNVLWLGVSDESGELARLHERIEEECAAASFPRERKSFHPHVTLARIREAKGETRRLSRRHVELAFEPVAFAASEIVLMRSTLGPGGSFYAPLARHELKETTGDNCATRGGS